MSDAMTNPSPDRITKKRMEEHKKGYLVSCAFENFQAYIKYIKYRYCFRLILSVKCRYKGSRYFGLKLWVNL